jgi:hypothetical protein
MSDAADTGGGSGGLTLPTAQPSSRASIALPFTVTDGSTACDAARSYVQHAYRAKHTRGRLPRFPNRPARIGGNYRDCA